MSTEKSKPHAGEEAGQVTLDEIVGAPRQARVDRLPCIIDDDEPMGGDPPCWAHLFEDGDEAPPADR
jgi:hypothetical protein